MTQSGEDSGTRAGAIPADMVPYMAVSRAWLDAAFPILVESDEGLS
jgi:hypothetical protein